MDTINDNGLKDLAISSVGILITLNSNKALDIILVLSNTQYEDYIFRLDNYMNDFQFGGGGIAFLETGGGIHDIKNDSGVAFRYTMGVFTFPTYEYFPYRD